MASPEVTALIGSWNNAATLPRAIESVLAQGLRQLELIVVDDGSTDETPDIVRNWRDPRVRLLSLEHMGIARSLNRGLEEAGSDLVAVLDADDWALPGRLERQVQLLRARPEVAVTGCLMREVDEQGTELRRRLKFATGDVTDTLLRFNSIPNTSAAFRRSAVLDAGGYDPRWRYAMEYDLWLRLAESNRIWNIGEELAVRELGSANAGARNERAQMTEALRIRLGALRRRRSLRGAGGLAYPFASYAAPMPLRRAVRRARGMAP